jgi:hypothetical protein
MERGASGHERRMGFLRRHPAKSPLFSHGVLLIVNAHFQLDGSDIDCSGKPTHLVGDLGPEQPGAPRTPPLVTARQAGVRASLSC